MLERGGERREQRRKSELRLRRTASDSLPSGSTDDQPDVAAVASTPDIGDDSHCVSITAAAGVQQSLHCVLSAAAGLELAGVDGVESGEGGSGLSIRR